MTEVTFHSEVAEAETIEKKDAKETSERTALRGEIIMVRGAPYAEARSKGEED